MFVKMYQYHIQIDRVEEYLAIQERTAKIYGKYLDFHTIHLNSKHDVTKWIEITSYKDEEDYRKSIHIINQDQEIQDLFEEFKSLLLNDKSEISEEDFILRLQK